MPRRRTIGMINSYVSGTGTNNVIPKDNGAGVFTDSALTDNGTQVISTEPIRTPVGASGAVGLQVGAANDGFYVGGGLLKGQKGGTDAIASSATQTFVNGLVIDLPNADCGISRISAATLAVGNGTNGNTAGNLQLAKITSYNATATAGNGVGAIVGMTSQKSESGADANVLTVTPPAAVGTYRLSISMQVSAQNTATLGWTATWTDANGSAQAPTNLALTQTGVAAPALTFTAATNGNYHGEAIIDINNAATSIVIKTTFSGTSITYKVSATIERLN